MSSGSFQRPPLGVPRQRQGWRGSEGIREHLLDESAHARLSAGFLDSSGLASGLRFFSWISASGFYSLGFCMDFGLISACVWLDFGWIWLDYILILILI